jgi:hypothetical protein
MSKKDIYGFAQKTTLLFSQQRRTAISTRKLQNKGG